MGVPNIRREPTLWPHAISAKRLMNPCPLVASNQRRSNYQENPMSAIDLSRRGLVAGALTLPFASLASAAEFAGPLTPKQRQQLVLKSRRAVAQALSARPLPIAATNGDEDRYVDRRANFS